METLVCSRAEMPRIKFWALMTQPDQDTKRWDLWESDEGHQEDVMVIDEETEEMPPVFGSLIQRKILNSDYPKLLGKICTLSLSLEVVNLTMSLKCKHTRR